MKLLFALVLLSGFLNAHKLNIFLYEENDKVKLNSYFASGTPCRNCEITIFDQNLTLLEKSKTDMEGTYSFEKLSKKLIIIVEALGGHAAKSEIEVKNLPKKRTENEINPIVKSLIAAFLIALIFLALKRFSRE